MGDAGDEYVRVRGWIQAVREKSVLFAVGESVRRAGWIPRSCIHGADDLQLDGKMVGDAMTLRIREWKADELGFTSTRNDDAADRDLFA